MTIEFISFTKRGNCLYRGVYRDHVLTVEENPRLGFRGGYIEAQELNEAPTEKIKSKLGTLFPGGLIYCDKGYPWENLREKSKNVVLGWDYFQPEYGLDYDLIDKPVYRDIAKVMGEDFKGPIKTRGDVIEDAKKIIDRIIEMNTTNNVITIHEENGRVYGVYRNHSFVLAKNEIMGFRLAYVEAPEFNNASTRKIEETLDPYTHGGVTYVGKKYPWGERGEDIVIGMDYGHLGDGIDPDILKENLVPQEYKEMFSFKNGYKVPTQEDVIEDVKYLIDAIVEEKYKDEPVYPEFAV